MFLLVFVVLLGTVATAFIDQPHVEINLDIVNGGSRLLTCRARGFVTSDIILNIKKNRCVLTKEDGVETEGVQQYGNIYWRRDSVTILKSEVSHYSCEVVHASSRFRVEKVWDPETDGGGRIISFEFIEKTPPHVFMFPENSKVQTNIMLTCLVSGFYPNNIILNMKRNRRILTREDGVESSGVCSNEDDTFQRRDSVEIKKSDESDFSCEVIHHASGSRVEKIWDRHLPPPPGSPRDCTVPIVVAVVVVLLLVVVASMVLVVLKRLGVLGTFAKPKTINSPGSKSSPFSDSSSGGSSSSTVSASRVSDADKSLRQRKEMD